MFNRQEVWAEERYEGSLRMPITFQPEELGYYVASITVGRFVSCLTIGDINLILIIIQMVISSMSHQTILPVMD